MNSTRACDYVVTERSRLQPCMYSSRAYAAVVGRGLTCLIPLAPILYGGSDLSLSESSACPVLPLPLYETFMVPRNFCRMHMSHIASATSRRPLFLHPCVEFAPTDRSPCLVASHLLVVVNAQRKLWQQNDKRTSSIQQRRKHARGFLRPWRDDR